MTKIFFSQDIEYDIISGHLTKKDIPRGHCKQFTEQKFNALKIVVPF